MALMVLVGAVALATASTAAALPANPWTGQWLNNNNELVTLTQSGSQITGTQLCPNTTSLPGITLTGTASADNTVANFSYQSSICTGVGGTFTGTMAASGRRVDGTGTTQFGTGFTFFFNYQSGGNEPRESPPAPPPPPPGRALCPGGPWSGLWTANGSEVFSFSQSGNTFSGTLVNGPETYTGTISGNTVNATFRIPEGTGTWRLTLAPDLNSFTRVGTTTTGRPFGPLTSTFIGCSTGLAGVDLTRTIPAPQTLQGGPTTIVAPGTVSLTSLTRSKCVLVKVASSPAGADPRLDLQRAAQHPPVRAEARRVHRPGAPAGLHPGALPRPHLQPADAAQRGARLRRGRDAEARRAEAQAGDPADQPRPVAGTPVARRPRSS